MLGHGIEGALGLGQIPRAAQHLIQIALAPQAGEALRKDDLPCEADVAQDDARCVTYLGVREGRDILKKWNQYRNCDT